MTADEAQTIRAGDRLLIDPLWNSTSTRGREVCAIAYVLQVTRARSQTGVMVKVMFSCGEPGWLDAGWFTGKASA